MRTTALHRGRAAGLQDSSHHDRQDSLWVRISTAGRLPDPEAFQQTNTPENTPELSQRDKKGP